jgi:hypothetical protein
MTAAAQAAPSRAEINRRNAQMSTGPKTAAGRERVKFNALKHGLRAKTIVLPGEEEVFRTRHEAWTIATEPRDEAERFLVSRAVALTLKLDRVSRAVEARRAALRHADADRLAVQAEEVVVLGRRLLWDPVGPLSLYPHAAPATGEPQRVSDSRDPEDPDDPARLVVRLEAMALGCAWLSDRWGELRDILEDGLLWQPHDRLKAIRLLGRQPLDAVDDKRVMAIYLCCWAMDPEDRFGFTDLYSELTPRERTAYLDRLNAREPLDAKPASPEAAREALLALIVEEEGRLEAVLAGHLEREEAEAEARLAFDDSAYGEQLRKYELECDKALLRIIEMLRKRRQAAGEPSPGERAAAPAGLSPIPSTVASFVSAPDGPEPAGTEVNPQGDLGCATPDPAPVSVDCPPIQQPDVAAPRTATEEVSGPAERLARSSSGLLAVLALIVLLCSAGLSAAFATAREEGRPSDVPIGDPCRPQTVRAWRIPCGRTGSCAAPGGLLRREAGGLTVQAPMA